MRQPDPARQQALAELSKSHPPTLERCVHLTLGIVEVIEKLDDRWAFRMPPSEFVEDREPSAFRPLLSKVQAQGVLDVFVKAKSQPLPKLTDAERRARCTPLMHERLDLRKPLPMAKKLALYTTLKAHGVALWTMERQPCLRFKEPMVPELAEVLALPRASVEALLPG